jgi:hypothetical protein
VPHQEHRLVAEGGNDRPAYVRHMLGEPDGRCGNGRQQPVAWQVRKQVSTRLQPFCQFRVRQVADKAMQIDRRGLHRCVIPEQLAVLKRQLTAGAKDSINYAETTGYG